MTGRLVKYDNVLIKLENDIVYDIFMFPWLIHYKNTNV